MYVPFILFKGIGKIIPFNYFILDSAIVSDSKMRNVVIWHWAIITANQMVSKSEDQIVHYSEAPWMCISALFIFHV